MGLGNTVQELFNIDWKTMIMSIIIVVTALIAAKEFNDKFIKLFGIETPKMKRERERKEEIKAINEKLEEIHDKQQAQSNKSMNAESRIDNKIQEIGELLNSLTVASMRSTLWRIHSESTDKGFITPEGLKTFTECGKLYESAGGDDIYHEKLYPDVMSLPIQSKESRRRNG